MSVANLYVKDCICKRTRTCVCPRLIVIIFAADFREVRVEQSGPLSDDPWNDGLHAPWRNYFKVRLRGNSSEYSDQFSNIDSIALGRLLSSRITHDIHKPCLQLPWRHPAKRVKSAITLTSTIIYKTL